MPPTGAGDAPAGGGAGIALLKLRPIYFAVAFAAHGARMSLSAVIVDDEQLARDELMFLLKSAGDVEVVAQGRNGLEAITLIKEHSPDIVFLDVQMPGLD